MNFLKCGAHLVGWLAILLNPLEFPIFQYLVLQIRILFDYLQKGNDFFTMSDILKLWKSNPYVFQINSSIFQKTVYSTEAEELKAAQELLEKQEMNRAAEIIKSVL